MCVMPADTIRSARIPRSECVTGWCLKCCTYGSVMSNGSPPPTIQRSPFISPFCGVPPAFALVVSTASGSNTDSTACAVNNFSIDAGISGAVGRSLKTMRPPTATVRQRESGARDNSSVRCALRRLSATGAAIISGTRRAERTGVIGELISCGAAGAGALSACAATESPDTAATTSISGATYHCTRRRGMEFSRGLAVGDGGRTPTGATARRPRGSRTRSRACRSPGTPRRPGSTDRPSTTRWP